MGSGASSIKPQSLSKENDDNESGSLNKISREKEPRNTLVPILDSNDRESPCNGQAKSAKTSTSSSAELISRTSLIRQSKDSPGLLPPIKKQSSNSSTGNAVYALNSSSSKDRSYNDGSDFERVKQLENELANNESERRDAEDQVRVLESRLKDLMSGSVSSNKDATQLNETVHAKDQYIVKLEKDLKSQQADANCVRLKLKKRIKGLTNHLHEVRQEASITQMELRQELIQSSEKLKELSSSQTRSSVNVEDSSASNSKVIVEISNQLSEQEEKIALLEAQVVEKDLLIESLKSRLKDRHSMNSNQPFPESQPSQGHMQPSGDRLQSGRGSRYQSSNRVGTSENHRTDSTKTPTTRQSMALSDSDSDWDTSEVASHTHSAPARMRVKSDQSIQSVSKQASLGGNLQSDDDSIMQYLNNQEHSEVLNYTSDHHRVKPHKKSALKSHLEKRKVENQTGALMGPSLAFHTKESPPDTSCEPIPRNTDPSKLPGFSKLTAINAGYH